MFYSHNQKLNGLLNEIEEDLLNMCDSQEESLDEIERYYKHFQDEPDYNIAQYGCLLVYYTQVREFYEKYEYKKAQTFSDTQLWNTYRKQVGFVVKQIMSNIKK